MDEKDVVRVCPFCVDHPPYLEGTLQCVECGVIRPKRMSSVTWHSCVKGASEPAQDALDCEFHSASSHGLSAAVDVECHFLGTYRIVEARLSRTQGDEKGLLTGTEASGMLVQLFARHGLLATV